MAKQPAATPSLSMPVEAFRKAQRHLARRDSILKQLIATVGPCTLQPNPDAFLVLVRSIIAQLISTKAAASIFARLQQSVGTETVTPAALVAAGASALRSAGLSGAKTRALTDLATRIQDGTLNLQRLPEMSDEEVIAQLVPVYGIGTWTAQMFLIFCLGRLDVLPVEDLGLRAGVQDQYGLPALPDKASLRERAEPWRPYRSIATWYFWRSRGFVPQSNGKVNGEPPGLSRRERRRG
jgi:DNA-3-methyladenine glycosylase II